VSLRAVWLRESYGVSDELKYEGCKRKGWVRLKGGRWMISKADFLGNESSR
jgi:hypothetical protein